MVGAYPRAVIFDIETDGLIDEATKIHSLVIRNAETPYEVYSCHDHRKDTSSWTIRHGLKVLENAELIIGHNIIGFDIPVIKKLYPEYKLPDNQLDTLLLSRLYKPELRDIDFAGLRTGSVLPNKLIGRHSLEAWGYRLGVYKGEFGKTTDWKEWSEEMQEYCAKDTEVTLGLYMYFKKYIQEWGRESLNLEHDFAKIIQKQIEFGFSFNEKGAVELYATLAGRRSELEEEFKEVFPQVDKGDMFTPKVNNATKGYVKGVPIWRTKMVEFNPASRDHIAERLKEKYDWTPEVYTDSGKPKVDEEVLSKLDYPEAKLLTEYLTINKRIGQLAEGEQAWLKTNNTKTGRIHGGVTTNGAVTGRCTHHNPNIAQVPAVGALYGEECRALFGPPKGYYQLGCDASGLELRCLAHYMAKYDNGAYIDVILNGDIHTTNQLAAGLETRNEAKRFIYAYLYGGGDVLIGSLFKPDFSEEKQRALGKKVKKKFLDKTPALASLIETVKATASKRGYLRGLDGRCLHVRSEHSALNLLLQSAGALIMKQATVILWRDLEEEMGYVFGREVAQMAHIHDEYQLAIRDDIDHEVVGKIAVGAIRKAGEYFKFRCPLDGEYKTGKNWKETH